MEYANSMMNNENTEIKALALNLLSKAFSNVSNEVKKNQGPGLFLSEVGKNNQIDSEFIYKWNLPFHQESSCSKENKYSHHFNSLICEFCGKFDKDFTVEKLDHHMYWDCPMLFQCPNCHNITEILYIRWHLLNECKSKEIYRECHRCKEPIIVTEFEDHLFQNNCPPNVDEKSIRCPLCKKEIIPPTLSSWRIHIMEEICPRNKRSFF